MLILPLEHVLTGWKLLGMQQKGRFVHQAAEKNFTLGIWQNTYFSKYCKVNKLDRFAEFLNAARKLYNPNTPLSVNEESSGSEDTASELDSD